MMTTKHKKVIGMHKACAFTGHRASKLPWRNDIRDIRYIKFRKKLGEVILEHIDKGVTTFYTGGQNGTDLIAAEVVLELKRKLKDIKLIFVLPFEEMANDWDISQRERFYNVMSECDEEMILNAKYCEGCYKQRNKYMVKNSGYLIAVYDGKNTRSGTLQTINIARMSGRNITIINPITLEV